MHCRRDFFRFWPLPALILASALPAALASHSLFRLHGAAVGDAAARQAAHHNGGASARGALHGLYPAGA